MGATAPVLFCLGVAVVLIVSADDVARRLRIPLPLDADTTWLIEQAIGDAQAEVEAYLGRPVTVREFVEHGVEQPLSGGWPLVESPVVEVLSVVPEDVPPVVANPLGAWGYQQLWTVTYRAGLEADTDPQYRPIQRYVAAAAMLSPDVQALLRQVAPDQARKVTSVNVTGQGITWEDTWSTEQSKAGSGVAGAPPALASLDRWRIAGRRVYQRPRTRPLGIWPYDGSPWISGG